jgi:hypothetical protein
MHAALVSAAVELGETPTTRKPPEATLRVMGLLVEKAVLK